MPDTVASTSPAPDRRLSLGVFDGHHPPAAELIDDCVHCGFCLPTCPTYALWGEEMDSPRGRIYLMKLGLEGQARLTDAYVGHFDKCLGCMACLTSCPSGVQYDKLIEATRAQIERRFPRSAGERLWRRFLLWIFPYPARLRLAALPLWLHQKLGLAHLLRRSGLLDRMPTRLAAMMSLAPPVSLRRIISSFTSPALPPGTKPRLRVGLLLGCVQQVFFGDVNDATARVLAAEGCEVVAPPNQQCCGALMVHSGHPDAAVEMMRRTIDAFDAANVDVIAINAAGCGSVMKEYGHLLRDDPIYARKAEAFASKCRDVSEILAELEPVAPRHALTCGSTAESRRVLRVVYHAACHLEHAQRVTAEPRNLLLQIPGLELLEPDEAAICCGSAGIYNLLEPQAARQLGDRKAVNLAETQPDAIVTANPGCILQIRAALERAGASIPVLHLVELLDASIRGDKVENAARMTDDRHERDSVRTPFP